MQRNWMMIGSIALALAGAGCNNGGGTGGGDAFVAQDGSASDGGPRDGGGDAGPRDGGGDAGGTDAGRSDAGGGSDAGLDGGVADTGAGDAGTDTGPMADVGTDGGRAAFDFHVTSFDTTNCDTIDVLGVVGDDRGGIAMGADRVFLSGDDATGAWDLALNNVPTGSLSGATRDDIVTDVTTGQLYLLGDDAGPLGLRGGSSTQITRLYQAQADASASTTFVTLSAPIAIDPGTTDVGIFAGAGEIGIHNGANLFVVNVSTGAVQDLGALTLPTYAGCENWAFWGVLERVGGAYSIVFVQSSTAIVRVAAPAGTVTTVGTYTDLSDMCSITISPSTHRWYFHHEYNSQLTPTTFSETLGACDATIDTTGGNLSITSLDTTGCNVIDDYSVVGDDRGGIAVTPSYVYLAGDNGLGRWALDLTAGVGSAAAIRDAMVSNLRTGDVYSLATDTDLLTDTGGTVTRLVLLDGQAAPTSTAITLSAPITLGTSTDVGIFAGWDEIAIHDGAQLWTVQIPSGDVVNQGVMAAPTHSGCENWAYWGILEDVAGAYSVIVQTGMPSIDRFAVPGGEQMTISTFTDLSDMCSITVHAGTSRWYFHHEYSSQLTVSTTMDETLGYCDATLVHP